MAVKHTRWGRLAQSVTLVVATLAIVVFANVLAARHLPRLDVTATGEHQLAPRTRSLIALLNGQHRIVVAADLSRIDARARRDANDVVEEFRRASPLITVTRIDTGSAGGMSDYAALLGELAARDRVELDAQSARVREALVASGELATYLDQSLSPVLTKMRDSVPATAAGADNVRAYLDQRAAACRLAARDLQKAAQTAAGRLEESIAGVAFPDTTTAASELSAALTVAVDAVGVLATDIRKLVDADSLPISVRDLAKPLAVDVPARRDNAAIVIDGLARLPKIAVLRVATVLKNASGVLVVGPKDAGMTVIPAEDFFLSSAALDVSGAAKADIRRRCEDLLASALGGLARPNKPIVVFVHAEPRAFVIQSQAFTSVLDRLARQGIDIVEWAPLANAEQPSLAALDPKGLRPVVYIALAPDSSTSARGQNDLPGPTRASKLGQVLTKLADDKKQILLCLNPSVLPTYGDSDPVAAVLTRFGLKAETGQPILSSLGGERGASMSPLAQTDALFVVQSDSLGMQPSLIAKSITSLRVMMPWPVALRANGKAADAEVWSIVEMPSGEAWRETQWLRLWQTPRAQRNLLADQPKYDPGTDLKDGPWLLAAAAQMKSVEGAASKQRLIAVGSSNWLVDQVTQQVAMVDGRAVPVAPANLELLDASVAWLAGEDDLIAPGPGARSIALVSALQDRQLIALRLLLVIGLPLGVLGLGVAYRLWRG